MLHKYIIYWLCFVFFISNCGGGGGKYYPPQVVNNKIGVIKTEIINPQFNDKLKLSLEVGLDRRPEKEKFIAGTKYYYFNGFKYNNKEYFLAIPLDGFVSIFDSERKLIKKLATPRYTTVASALELNGINKGNYLAIYIQQQTTSHSSTLFILNNDFDVVYKEHLLGALWMAREPTERGHNLIISAETKWMPKGKWISVGGPWRYNVFK